MSKQFQKIMLWYKMSRHKLIRKYTNHKRSSFHKFTDIFAYFSTYSVTCWIWQQRQSNVFVEIKIIQKIAQLFCMVK